MTQELVPRPSSLVHGPLDAALQRELLDAHFDGTPGLAQEFPLLLDRSDPAQDARAWAVCDGDRYLAHAVWRPLELITPERSVAAAGIGLVTTHRDHRSRGLASELVRACVAQAQREGAELALLFSPVRSLYTRLGFVPAGRERITQVVPRSESVGMGDRPVRAGSVRDAAQLVKLLERHVVRVARSVSETERLLQIPHLRVWIWEEQGAVRAYCVEGKGRDLQGVIHEWAGEAEAVRQLLRWVVNRAGRALHVLSPARLAPPVEGDHREGSFVLAKPLRAPLCASRAEARKEIYPAAPSSPLEPAERDARSLDLEALGVPDFYVWGLDSI